MGKRIVIWGTGTRCAMWYKWLGKHIEVAGFITNNLGNCDFLLRDGYSVLPIEHHKEYSYDLIVLLTPPECKEEVRQEAVSAGIPMDKLLDLDAFLEREGLAGKYEADAAETQCRIIREILEASDKDIASYDWMLRKILNYGVYSFPMYRNGRELADINWSSCGMLQVPEEFAAYCVMLGGLRIQDAIEVGVFKGASSYFACAVLSRKNPDLRYMMVDVHDSLAGFEKFNALLPALQKRIPSTSGDHAGQLYDYVFIDADHSYEASIADYNNLGQYAKVITAFHDIYAHEYDGENGGTVRTWKEVLQRTERLEHREYSIFPDQWMGIGCVLK